LSDGREVEAEIVGRDRAFDLAVLRIDLDDLDAIDWGDSRQVSVGEQVLALGSPYGLHRTVTSGIISTIERYGPEMTGQDMRRNSRRIPQEYLQTDAAINTGNSGGALVDMNGKLIGICTFIVTSENGGNNGIGFAIPSVIAKHVYEEIVLYGEVKHGWIGVELTNVTLFEARQMNQQKPRGAIITNFVRGNSPARAAGFQRGDIVLRWGETEITHALHFIHTVTLTPPGTKETVEVFRNGEWITIKVTVGERPTNW
jgi:S1-C subfamily serine protease